MAETPPPSRSARRSPSPFVLRKNREEVIEAMAWVSPVNWWLGGIVSPQDIRTPVRYEHALQILGPWRMSELTDDMIDALVQETIVTLPDNILAFFRNPPGRKPHEYVLRIHSVIAGMDDATAKELVQHVVDSTVFSILYLIDSEFRGRGIDTEISRGSDSLSLSGSMLHELYRMKVDPGGERYRG